MSYILVLWTIIGFQHNGAASTSNAVHDWRPIGQFQSATACAHAAKLLGKNGNSARCLPTGTAGVAK